MEQDIQLEKKCRVGLWSIGNWLDCEMMEVGSLREWVEKGLHAIKCIVKKIYPLVSGWPRCAFQWQIKNKNAIGDLIASQENLRHTKSRPMRL